LMYDNSISTKSEINFFNCFEYSLNKSITSPLTTSFKFGYLIKSYY
jgi:hypothetical protein